MAASREDIRLALSSGSSSDVIAVADLLALADAERTSISVTPSWCVLSLIVDGEDRWGPQLSLGALGVVVAQLAQAATRLERGELAVLRAGVFDVPEVLLLLFEPIGEDGVVATPGVTKALPDPSWTADGPHAERLYAFVGEQRDRLVEAGQVRQVAPERIGRSMASAALRREARLGAAAVALLGPGRC